MDPPCPKSGQDIFLPWEGPLGAFLFFFRLKKSEIGLDGKITCKQGVENVLFFTQNAMEKSPMPKLLEFLDF